MDIPAVEEIVKNMSIIKDKGTRPKVRHTVYKYEFEDSDGEQYLYRADVITVVRHKSFYNDIKLNSYHEGDLSIFENICEWGTYDIFSLQEHIAEDILEHIKSTVLEES